MSVTGHSLGVVSSRPGKVDQGRKIGAWKIRVGCGTDLT